jgi:hypothetical protein
MSEFERLGLQAANAAGAADTHDKFAKASREHDRELLQRQGRQVAEDSQQQTRDDRMAPFAGVPAELVDEEQTAWRRLSPRRNRWRDVATYDEQVRELDARAQAVQQHGR